MYYFVTYADRFRINIREEVRPSYDKHVAFIECYDSDGYNVLMDILKNSGLRERVL